MTIEVPVEPGCCAEKATTVAVQNLTTNTLVEHAACALKRARELAEEATGKDDVRLSKAHLLVSIAGEFRAIATHVPLG
jgi:hypothetical protein